MDYLLKHEATRSQVLKSRGKGGRVKATLEIRGGHTVES